MKSIKSKKERKEKRNKKTKTIKIKHSFLKKVHSSLLKSNSTSCLSNLTSFETENIKTDDLIKTRDDLNKELVKLLDKKTVPSHILPNNDFYTFINYEWMKYAQTSLSEREKYIVQLDDFRLVQNKVYEDLMELVKDYIQKNHKTNKKAQQIKNVYDSISRLLSTEQVNHYLKEYINNLDEYISTDDLQNNNNIWTFLGKINQNEIISSGLPFVFSINPDNKNSTIFRCYVTQPDVTCLDLDVYFVPDSSAYLKNYKKTFIKYVNDLFDAWLPLKNDEQRNDELSRGEQIYQVEKEILEAIICTKQTKNLTFYNRIERKEAIKDYDFNWDIFSRELGFKVPPNFFISGNINYLKCGTKLMLDKWKTPAWRTYFIYIFLRQLIRFHKTGRLISFEFGAKFMRGQQVLFPDSLLPIFGLALCFNTFLTNEYVKKYTNPTVIHYVKVLAEDLRKVFVRKIKQNTWLEPKTKQYALKKLKYLKLEVGSPVELRIDPTLKYDATDLWSNFTKIVHWRHDNLCSLEGQGVIDIPMIDWMNFPFKLVGSQSYIVNAFYTPTKNGIYIPLAYLQKPFIDLEERGIEYNLSRIGFTLGHEMSHALDDLGSQYNHLGNLHNWWTEKDKAIFKRKQKNVIQHYEDYCLKDGIVFDASMSIGEDLADISGLAILMEYLKDFQDKNADIIPIKVLSFKAFFIYFAIQSRQKIVSKRAIQAQLKTNPHPLDKYRVNVPLSLIEMFRHMYNVKKGDGMYWSNTDTIW